MAAVRRTGQPLPVRRDTVATLTMTSPTTGHQYGPHAADPSGQRDKEDGQASLVGLEESRLLAVGPLPPWKFVRH